MIKSISQRKKTVVRAIRLTEELDEALRVEAQSNGVTTSSLISSILIRYIAVDRDTKNLGTINVARKWFSHILDVASEESLRKFYPAMKDEWQQRIEFRSA